jgi:hypothetical protein
MKSRLIIYPLLLIVLLALWAQVTQPVFPVDSSTAIVSTDPQRLRAHVETISRDFYPRDEGHPENLAKLATYIQSAFENTGADVTRHTFKVKGNNYSNVYAAFGPATQERIIVGAHYDTVPGTPGADDNASGIAGLIELGHLLKNAVLSTRVELAAYALEEPPYFYTPQMGSAQHVKLLQQENVKVRMMFALEMIGYFSDKPDSQYLPMPVLSLLYPHEGNFIMVAGQFLDGTNVRIIKRTMRGASSLPVYSINAPGNLLGINLSDHVNFWNADLPAVMITDTAFYRYDGYHSPTDTADRLDYERMAMVVEGVYAAVLALADEPD